MATVVSKTSIKIDDLINDTIISGQIVDGHLILVNRGGAQIDAGVVTSGSSGVTDHGALTGLSDNDHPQYLTAAEGDAAYAPIGSGSVSALDFMPVGYIYMSVVSTSPATLFGGGTWVRIGQGRVLVGQDGTQTEFDTAEETGGEKTHTLSTAELPAHTHSVDHDHASFQSGNSGTHTHTITRKTGSGTSTGVVRGGVTADADGTDNSAGSHNHTVDVPAHVGSSGSVGSGTPANNLQPYLVVFMWKRTA